MTTTINDIITRERELDTIYKIIIANEQNNYVVEDAKIKMFQVYITIPVLHVSDENVKDNSGIYTCDEIGALKYINGEFTPVGMNIPNGWRAITCQYNKGRKLD